MKTSRAIFLGKFRPWLLAGIVAVPLAASAAFRPSCDYSQAPRQAGDVGKWEAHEEAGMPFRLLKPAGYDPRYTYPLIVFLHGQGDDVAADKMPSADRFFNTPAFRAKYPAIVIAPQCAGSTETWRCSWGGSQFYPRRAEVGTLATVAWAARNFPVNRCRAYLTGMSLGGNGVWDLAWRAPDVFAAAAPVAGATWYWGTAKLAALRELPLWIVHGELDTDVPAHYDEANSRALQRLGARRMVFEEYPGAEHNVWDQVYGDSTFWEWLFSQRL